jgi:hypothetical protein
MYVSVSNFDVKKKGDFSFLSYLDADLVIASRAFGDFEKTVPDTFKEIESFFEKNRLKQLTPVFCIPIRHGDLSCIDIKVGYSRHPDDYEVEVEYMRKKWWLTVS